MQKNKKIKVYIPEEINTSLLGDNMIYLHRISQEAKNKSFKRNVNSARAWDVKSKC